MKAASGVFLKSADELGRPQSGQMFIAKFTENNSGAPAQRYELSKRGEYLAPLERSRLFLADGYKHFVPPGLKLKRLFASKLQKHDKSFLSILLGQLSLILRHLQSGDEHFRVVG